VGERHPLPDYAVAKGIWPGGIRLPERPKLDYRVTHDVLPLFNPLVRGGSGTLTVDGDALTYGDFRYWSGYNNAASLAYSACRKCGEVCLTAETRREHLKLMGCGSVLTRAFQALGRDKKCVVCDLISPKRLWGIPICCKDCEYEWKFTTRCPSALHAAIGFVEASE
jgi:hypothetical protein